MNQEEVLLENEELQELLGEGTVKLSEPSSYQFLNSIFWFPKKMGVNASYKFEKSWINISPTNISKWNIYFF